TKRSPQTLPRSRRRRSASSITSNNYTKTRSGKSHDYFTETNIRSYPSPSDSTAGGRTFGRLRRPGWNKPNFEQLVVEQQFFIFQQLELLFIQLVVELQLLIKLKLFVKLQLIVRQPHQYTP